MKYIETFESRKYKTMSRREHIAEDTASVLNRLVPWYDPNGVYKIYRGVKHSDNRKVNQDVYQVNPGEFERYSNDSLNIHNLVIDNNEAWKDYPKRSGSVICTSRKEYANDFGEVYRVIPLDMNAKVGTCDNYDIFYSFHEVNGIDSDSDEVDDIRGLDKYIEETFTLRGVHSAVKSYKELEGILKIENLDLHDDGTTTSGMTKEKFIQIEERYGSFLKYIESYMTPDDNDFGLKQFKDLDFSGNSGDDGFEVWLDQPCLLVNEKYFSDKI